MTNTASCCENNLPERCQGAGPARTGPHKPETPETVCVTLASVYLNPGRYTIVGIPAGHAGGEDEVSMAPLNVIVKTAARRLPHSSSTGM